MQKKIVTIYYADDWNKEIPISNEATRQSFEIWHTEGIKKGVEFYRASIQWYNSEKNTFEKAWAFRDGKWKRIKKEITPDMVYDKVGGARNHQLHELKMKMSESTKVFNSPLFQTFLGNKLNQQILFSEFMPKAFLVLNQLDLQQKLKKIETDKVVIKQFHGSGGFGVTISEKNEVLAESIKYPVLLQEFIKSNVGIPGFSPQGVVADLRIVLMNNKFSYALSRIAKNGSLFTNFHQGASAVMVPQDKIPTSANEIVTKIIEKLSLFPETLYSIDFMFSNDGKPYLIELNTTPGIDLLFKFGSQQQQEQFFDDFINIA